MSINENPKLESVETLASQSSELLRDLIADCHHAIKLEPMMAPYFEPPHRLPINLSRFTLFLAKYAEDAKRVSDTCTDDEKLMILLQWLVGTERGINAELALPGSLANREPEFAEPLKNYASCLVGLVGAINRRVRLLVADEFRLPNGIQGFHFDSMLEQARRNGYPGQAQNLVELLNNHEHGTSRKQRDNLKKRGQFYDWTPQSELMFDRENFAAFLEKHVPKWRQKKDVKDM